MTRPDDILQAARSAGVRPGLDSHRGAIAALRAKGYTWRAVADFLREQGVETDHTTVYRFMRRKESQMDQQVTFTVPPASEYAHALANLDLTEMERQMLRAHYKAHNRTITYTELAHAADSDSHSTANRWYGGLGRRLGEALGMSFIPSGEDSLFYSSALGMGNPYAPPGAHFQFVMHHELAKAIEQLGWFQ